MDDDIDDGGWWLMMIDFDDYYCCYHHFSIFLDWYWRNWRDQAGRNVAHVIFNRFAIQLSTGPGWFILLQSPIYWNFFACIDSFFDLFAGSILMGLQSKQHLVSLQLNWTLGNWALFQSQLHYVTDWQKRFELVWLPTHRLQHCLAVFSKFSCHAIRCLIKQNMN